MDGKTFYPVFLDVDGRLSVVVGGGKVGLRKARGLIEAGARVRVVSPRFDAEFEGLEAERVEREYRAGDLTGAMLAFAATDRREVNRQVGAEAAALGVPVNVADAPEECGFIVPARLWLEGVQVAISSGGEDPAKMARIRAAIERAL
jgi:siroheme synthase-like protein